MDQRIELTIGLMAANLKEPLPLRRAARKVRLSVSHLSYLFRTEIGQSPGRYLMMLRMQRAAELLGDSSLSVKEIMDAVGFKDKSNFVRSFKKAYGVSPSAHRERNAKPVRGRNRKID